MTIELAIGAVGLALATGLFFALLSTNYYLRAHRLLPVVLAEIIVYNFLQIFEQIPIPGLSDLFFVQMLSDVTAMIITFLMYLYLLYMRKEKRNILFLTLFFLAMVYLLWMEIQTYTIPERRQKNAALLLIVLSVPVIHCIRRELILLLNVNSTREDKIVALAMLATFPVTFLCYGLQEVFFEREGYIISIGLIIVCIVYTFLIYTKRIEDTTTNLKESVFENAPYPMALLNKDFYMVAFNDVAYKNFEKGQGIESFFENGDYKQKSKTAENIVKTGSPLTFEKDGCWYKLDVTPTTDKRGLIGYVGYMSDITNERNSIVEARSEVNAKSQFLAMMSHELRSPLHAVIGISDILLGKREIGAKNRGLVGYIKNSANNLLDLVDAILDVSKIDAGKFEFAESNYNFDEMLREISYNNIVNLESKVVDFEIRMLTDYPEMLFGDSMRVREILQNIIGNSVKFTSEGHIYSEISCEKQEDKWHISFSVNDTGMGMDSEQLKRLFEDYVSSASSAGIQMEGTGLGMAITKKLVEKLGGNIQVSSVQGVGTTISADFYQKVAENSDIRQKNVFNRETVSYEVSNFKTTARPKWQCPDAKVLIADDMKINREILKQLLQPWKCKVTMVENGKDAVEIVKNNCFDLILLDQMMPIMNGNEAALLLSEMTTVPIILVTANTDDGVREKYRKYGFCDILPKPMKDNQLFDIMEQYIPMVKREVVADTSVYMTGKDVTGLRGYTRTLRTFIREVNPLYENLKDYAVNDRERFWIKVHGIKGAARQIGREGFADLAEVMEMAAKSEHWDYVNRHLDSFLADLLDVMEDVNKEISEINIEEEEGYTETEEEKEATEENMSFNDELKSIRSTFDEFDLSSIEKGLERIEKIAVEEAQKKLIDQLVDLCEELEYEEGVKLIDTFLEKN